MCSKCDEKNIAIARYRRLMGSINDAQMREAAEKLLQKIETEKLALHPAA